MEEKELQTRALIEYINTEIFSVRFSPDGTMLAAGCGDGVVRVYHSASGRLISETAVSGERRFPVTCVVWHPTPPSGRNILSAVCATGSVTHITISSNKAKITAAFTETDENGEPNETYAIAYSHDGRLFATAGRDRIVRVYDAEKNTIHKELSRGFGDAAGHSNRVFAIRFHPHDHNLLYSAGFDHTVQFWDIRVGKAVRSIYGTNVTGQALDMCILPVSVSGAAPGLILTGSARPSQQLQLWDATSGVSVKTIDWVPGHTEDVAESGCAVYGACFGLNGAIIAAGGSIINQGKVFYRASGAVLGYVNEESPVFTCDITSNGRAVAFGTSGGTIRVCTLSPDAAEVRAATHL